MNQAVFVQFADSMFPEGKELGQYLADNYVYHFDYRPSVYFLEIPTWIPIISGMLPHGFGKHLIIIEDTSEFDRAREEIHAYGSPVVFMSVSDANYKYAVKFIAGLRLGVKVIIGGYLGNEQQRSVLELLFDVTLVGDVKEVADLVPGAMVTGLSDYSLFRGWEALPRLQMSTGCSNRCKFCTVPSGVKELRYSAIANQVESFRPLKFKYVYIDDKTFGQCPNWTTLGVFGNAIRSYNPEFEGFIVQTTAHEVLDKTHVGEWQKWVKFVEVGVETVHPEWLRWMRKPHNTRQVEEAMWLCDNYGIGFIANFMTCFPDTEYEEEMYWIRRHKNLIKFINLYHLSCYSDSHDADDWFIYTPENANETTYNRTWTATKDILASQDFDDWVIREFTPVVLSMSQEEYVESCGQACPICRSTDLYWGDLDAIEDGAQQEVSCNYCGAEWYDVHKLQGYDLVRSGNG